MWPPGPGYFWPQGYYLNKLGTGPLDDTKYEGYRPLGFRQEDFFMLLPIYAFVKHLTPWARPFLAPGL